MDATGFSVSVYITPVLPFAKQMATRQEDGHTWHMAGGPQGVNVTTVVGKITHTIHGTGRFTIIYLHGWLNFYGKM